MKHNKWWFFYAKDGDFHVEFLDIFCFSCSLLPHVFFCISTVVSEAKRSVLHKPEEGGAKRKMFFRFAMWKFTYSGSGHQRMCFDLNGIEFYIPYFRELKVPARRRVPVEPVGS